jgi:hypothetical protein
MRPRRSGATRRGQRPWRGGDSARLSPRSTTEARCRPAAEQPVLIATHSSSRGFTETADRSFEFSEEISIPPDRIATADPSRGIHSTKNCESLEECASCANRGRNDRPKIASTGSLVCCETSGLARRSSRQRALLSAIAKLHFSQNPCKNSVHSRLSLQTASAALCHLLRSALAARA